MANRSRSALALITVVVLVGCDVMLRKPPESSAEPDKKTDFAADRDKGVPFDGKRAMGYLKDVCDIGPRVSGTDGMTKQQEMLKKHFEALGAKVEFQKFSIRQVSQRKATDMANMIISWHPDKERRVIFCSHYDTRPIADQERDRKNWTKPFVSANDGGSGVALLMEMGHHMKDLKTNVGVDFVLFDGEEYIFENDRKMGDKYFLGSEHFARTYADKPPKHKYIAAILLDMIAGKGARFLAEPNSVLHAERLVSDFWSVAREMKRKSFVNEISPIEVEDDHIPLNRFAKIPAIDIIDFTYEHWHKLSDTPENCSPEAMTDVAKVLGVWVERIK